MEYLQLWQRLTATKAYRTLASGIVNGVGVTPESMEYLQLWQRLTATKAYRTLASGIVNGVGVTPESASLVLQAPQRAAEFIDNLET